MKESKGITLIALIITIIVMLVLVGVTINVALNGGLFDKAKNAAKETEEKAMYEQIVMGMQLDDGKIKVAETYAEAQKTLKGYTITPGESGTNYQIMIVEGKNGTYTYTITDEKIIIGNEPPEPPQETNPVAGIYYMANMQMSITLNEDGTVTAPAELGLGDNPTYTYNDTTVTLNNNGSNISFYKLTDNKILVDENQQILFAINRNGLKGEEISGTYIHADGTNPDYQLIIDSEEGTWLELNNGSEKGSGHYFYYNNVIYGSGSIVGRVNQDGTITSAGTVWTKQQ